MTIRDALSDSTISRVACTPSISGMRTSINTTSGASLCVASTASRPFAASPTISMSGWVSITMRNAIRISS